MDFGDLLPTINLDSSIPELISFIRHSFRQCQFDEVQNILMNREKSMKDEKENLVRECESLKKELDSLENTQSLTALDNCSLEVKLETMQTRGEELDKIIVQKEEKIEKLENEKLELVEKLAHSCRKCEEMDNRLVTMVKEIGELKQENLCANKDIEEMKAKWIEAHRAVQELKRKNGEAAQTIDELRAKKMEIEKVKLETMQTRGEELDKIIVRKEEKIEKLESEKLELVEKLAHSCRKCEEMDNRLVTMVKEIEELKQENLCANKDIEEMKAKGIEADRAVQELNRKNEEAAQTIDELRAKKMEIENAAEVYRSGANDLNRRISMLEIDLAQMLSVDVKDLATLVNDVGNVSASATHNEVDSNSENGQLNSDAEERAIVSPEVPAVSDVRDVALSETEEDDANRVCTNPDVEPASSNSAAAEGNAVVQNNEDKEPVVRGEVAGNAVIEISDSDSDDENMPSKKRNRREGGEDSDIYCSSKRRRDNSAQPSGLLKSSSNVEERQMCHTDTDIVHVDLVESEDESCSDNHMNNLVAKLKSSG